MTGEKEKLKMKKITMIICTFAFIVSLSTTAIAQHDPAEKFASGVKDLVTAPFSYGQTISDGVNERENKVVGFAYGIFEGTDQLIGKVFSGVVNIVTFPWKW